MTDHPNLKPEDRALTEAIVFLRARTRNHTDDSEPNIPVHYIRTVLGALAARDEGRRAPGGGGDALVATIETALRNSLHWQNPDAVDKADHAIHLSGGVTPASSGCTLDLRDIAQSVADAISTRDEAALPEAYTDDERKVIADLREQLADCMDDHAEWLRENETVHEADAPPEIEINAHALKWLLDIAEGAPPPPPVTEVAGDVETVERFGDAIDAATRIHAWIDAIAAADNGKVQSREIRNYTFNEDDGGAVLYFRNNRVAAGGFMVRDLHNYTVSMKVFADRVPSEAEEGR